MQRYSLASIWLFSTDPSFPPKLTIKYSSFFRLKQVRAIAGCRHRRKQHRHRPYGITASIIAGRYRTKKKPDSFGLVRYRSGSDGVSFFHFGAGQTGCWEVWHSGILILSRRKKTLIILRYFPSEILIIFYYYLNRPPSGYELGVLSLCHHKLTD